MRFADRSLARRVGWTAGGAASVAAVATVLIATLVVDRLERTEASEDALSLARAMASELDSAEPESEEDLEAEVREFTHRGVSIAISGPEGQRIAGAADLPTPRSDGCEIMLARDTEWLVCAAATRGGRRVVVGETTQALLSHRRPLVSGGAITLLVVLLAGALAGLFVGRWSLQPLARLEGALTKIDAAHPEDQEPLPRSGLREVDAIASALDALFERSRNELARSRRFAADAAHELRTPLAKLRAEIELVAEELPADSTEQEALTGVVARVDELGRLVDRLLLLASPEETVRSDTLTSLAVVVETVVEDLSASEAKRVSVTLDADGLVTGDEAVLRSLVANAIDNALKYSDGEVRARVSRDGSDVVVRVDDDGPGLDPESRERAFEPFYRGAKERGQAGHGVGLALIAHVVSAHGGTARFLDGDGGARLELRLPRRDA